MIEGNLSCYTRRDGATHILALEGTLDMATAPYATEQIQRFLADTGPQMVLDTSRLDFIDSKGVGVLISAAKSARDAGGGVYLPNPAVPVRKILEICGLTSLFPPPPELPRAEEAAAPAASAPRASAAPKPAARSTAPRATRRAA